ncbi:hypothetical protein FH972_025265 [Carpinus fangiana]|uniref:Uncharacterized protein n=1 Tax=Carpinus fangiana TaxID=176857 RepID=A0A5N6L0N8_9ROSI|nr:hypothetical protein FH972_025265 [Carpinus fangiana]
MQNPPSPPPPGHPPFILPCKTIISKDPKTTLYVILAISLFSLFFFLSLSSSSSSTSANTELTHSSSRHTKPTRSSSPPSIAYLIFGSAGDLGRILRLLLATYHPRNFYLHLDLYAPQTDCDALALIVQSVPVFNTASSADAAKEILQIHDQTFAILRGHRWCNRRLARLRHHVESNFQHDLLRRLSGLGFRNGSASSKLPGVRRPDLIGSRGGRGVCGGRFRVKSTFYA